ncbi:MAG: hypothetical protein N2316_02305 [Spirochaetes bacterium]|nr:hypothetical protein [Spirochaetota bacterium]
MDGHSQSIGTVIETILAPGVGDVQHLEPSGQFSPSSSEHESIKELTAKAINKILNFILALLKII